MLNGSLLMVGVMGAREFKPEIAGLLFIIFVELWGKWEFWRMECINDPSFQEV